MIELKKYMARPAGCSFLGARATEPTVFINDTNSNPIPIIIDSGSDITLISQTAVKDFLRTTKISSGKGPFA